MAAAISALAAQRASAVVKKSAVEKHKTRSSTRSSTISKKQVEAVVIENNDVSAGEDSSSDQSDSIKARSAASKKSETNGFGYTETSRFTRTLDNMVYNGSSLTAGFQIGEVRLIYIIVERT